MSLPDNPTESDLIIGKLADLRALDRDVPTALARQVAARLKVHERTVWRRIAAERSRRESESEEPPTMSPLSELEFEAYAAFSGNAAAAWRYLKSTGEAERSLRSLQRAVARLPEGEINFIKRGIDGRRDGPIWLRHEAEYRNHRWSADAWEIPVWTVPRRGHNWIKPWAILYIDDFSRAITGHVVDVRHQTAQVLAAFKRAVLPDEDFGPFCGIPYTIRTDNGTEFTADETTNWYEYLGSYARPGPPNFPPGNGKIERFHWTLEQEWASGLPFYTGGARREDGKLYGPNTDPLTVKQLAHELDLYIQYYDTERPHSALDGRTPAEAWAADPTPIRVANAEELRAMPLPSQARKVGKDGVRFDGRPFIAAELNSLRRKEVEFRYIPYDYREIDVFFENRYVATAKPHERLTDEERRAVVEQRRRDGVRVNELVRQRSRRAQARFGLKPPPPGTKHEPPPSRRPKSKPDMPERKPMRKAPRDLLGLGDRNRPIDPGADGEEPS